MNQTPLDFLINKYYSYILKYCLFKLNSDKQGAEDCTQEVFLVFVKKVNELDMSKDLRYWLYAVADRKIKEYKKKHSYTISLEDIPEPSYEMVLDDSPISLLPQDERDLITAYYTGEDKLKLAQKYNISLTALYMRVFRIKEKLRDILDNYDN